MRCVKTNDVVKPTCYRRDSSISRLFSVWIFMSCLLQKCEGDSSYSDCDASIIAQVVKIKTFGQM